MYRRLFDTAGTGKTHYLIHILIWANLMFYFPYQFSTIFQCVPRARIWDPTLKGSCINVQAAFIAASAINVLSDFSILLLPLYRISRLKIPTGRKLGVLAIFAVGLLYVPLSFSLPLSSPYPPKSFPCRNHHSAHKHTYIQIAT